MIFLAMAYALSIGATDSAVLTPPMGWNSYDCYGTMVRDSQVRHNAHVMATNLKALGWHYIVVDACWYKPDGSLGTPLWKAAHPTWIGNMDQYGRFIPDSARFPTSAKGQGFAPLADSIHALGLKFGIHLMRGIPRQAVAANTPILGTSYTAAQIDDTTSICQWSTDMWGVNMAKPGAQAYYNSLLALYASWGVDFIKIDDLIRETGPLYPGNEYHGSELVGYRQAIDSCDRVIVMSASPGPASYTNVQQIAVECKCLQDFR